MKIPSVVVLVLIKLDAETPAAFPCFFVTAPIGTGNGVGGIGRGEGALAVRGGEICEGVAEGPAFVKGGFEGVDFVVGVGGWLGKGVVWVVVFEVFVGFGYVCRNLVRY